MYAISIALTIPIIILSLPHMIPQFGHTLSYGDDGIYKLYNFGFSNSNSILDWIYAFIEGFGMELKLKHQTWIH